MRWKNTPDKINGRLEEKISRLEDTELEPIQNKTYREKKWKTKTPKPAKQMKTPEQQ
jgi:hypothetical protein